MRRPSLAFGFVVFGFSLSAQRSALPAQPSLPAVHVIATGGTISNRTGGRLTGEELVTAIPQLKDVAAVTVEQFSNVASGAITVAQWLALSWHINELFRTRPELKGVVVTHGTDTMEETAYFLDLTVASCHPVVVTGAMRNPSMIAPEGPANLYNAIRIAAAPSAAGWGAMVELNDEIFAARDVAKTNTVRLDAFSAPGRGPIGVTDPEGAVFYRPPPPRDCATPAFDVGGVRELPRVDIVYTYIGADSVAIDAAVAAGAKGIVVATAGRGGTTPAQGRAMQRAVDRGVFIVVSSRTGGGRVDPGGEDNFARWTAGKGARIGANDLNPQKARVLLMLALSKTTDARAIAAMFGRL